MTGKYILDGHKPVPASLMKWARWFEKADRHVAITKKDDVQVSTVFLGINYNWVEGPPLLFETAIFGGSQDGYKEWCSTWDEAEAMHAKACELAFASSAGVVLCP